MVCFYRDVLGFEITEGEDVVNVCLIRNPIWSPGAKEPAALPGWKET